MRRNKIHTRFFVSLRAFLSYRKGRMAGLSPGTRRRKYSIRTFEFLSSSITRRSYGEKPATSRTTERTNLVREDWMPLRWLGLTVLGMEVVGRPVLRPTRRSERPHQ